MDDKVSKAQELLVKVFADSELRGRLREPAPEEIARIGAELGYDVDAADIREALVGDGEISDDELAAVAGGQDSAAYQYYWNVCGSLDCIAAGIYDF